MSEVEKHRLLIEHLPDAYAYHQLVADNVGNPVDYIVLDVNQAFEKMTGLKKEEVVGKQVTEIYPGIKNNSFDWIGTYGQMALQGESVKFQQYFEPTDCWYDVIAYSDSPGYFALVFRDITELKRKNVNLEIENKNLAATLSVKYEMLESAIIWIDTLDLDGNVTLWNKGAEKISGYTAEEVIGHARIWEWLYPDPGYRAEVFGKAQAILHEGEKVDEFETKIQRKDGIYRIISWHSNNFYIDSQLVGSIALGTDVTERKQAEGALRESEQRYRLLVDHAGEAIVVIQDGFVKYANPATVRTFGYSEKKLGSKPFLEFLHPEDQNYAIEEYTEVLNGKTIKPSFMIKVLTEKETIKWIEFNAVPIEWENRPAVLGFARDITKRKQVEDELRKSEERYRLLAENASDIIWINDLDLNYTYISPSVERILGYSAEELLFSPAYKTHTPYSQERAKRVLQEELAKEQLEQTQPGRTRLLELEHICKDGTTVTLESKMSFLRDQDGRPNGIFGISRDISDRKRAEEALRESEEKHRRLFETMNQGVIYQSADGAIISANPAAERILGLSLDQMQGKTSMDPHWQMIEEDGTAVPGKEHPAVIALQTGKKVGPVTRGIYNSEKSSHIWLNITAIPLFRPGDKEPFQAYATFEDITDRKQAEQALRESEEKYRGLFDSMAEAFELMELVYENGKPVDYIFLDVNPAWERMTGLKKEQVLGRKASEAVGFVESYWPEGLDRVIRTS